MHDLFLSKSLQDLSKHPLHSGNISKKPFYVSTSQHHSLALEQGRSGIVVSPIDFFGVFLSLSWVIHIVHSCGYDDWSLQWPQSKAILIWLHFRILCRCYWGKCLPFLLDSRWDVRFGAAKAILQPQEEKEANKKVRRIKRQENQGALTSFELPTEPSPRSKLYFCYVSW